LATQLSAMELEQADERFAQELATIQGSTREKLTALRNSYLSALLRFETRVRTGGDLDGVQAARQEIQRVENGESLLPPEPATHPDLLQMQEVIEQQLSRFRLEESTAIRELVQNVQRYASGQASSLTQQGEIPKALSWRNWGQELEEREPVERALTFLTELEGAAPDPDEQLAAERHPALEGEPVEIVTRRSEEFSERPAAYRLGSQPDGDEKRLRPGTPSMQGSGHTRVSVQVRLVDEVDTLATERTGWSTARSKAHTYVARLQISPLVGKPLGRTLAVFDLFKRGSGSQRELLRSDRILLPPQEPGVQRVVDSGMYRYETFKYRDDWGYRLEQATADEFYGYVVTVFDEKGNMILQRSSDRALDEYAREAPPE